MVLPLLPLIAAGLTAAAIAPEVATQVQRFKESSTIRDELVRPEAYRAFDAGIQSVENEQGLLDTVVGFVPGVGAVDTARQRRFFYAAQGELRKQGYDSRRAAAVANALMRDYVARSVGEGVSAVGATEVTAEVIGGKILAKNIPRVVERGALRNFVNPLARAGAKSSAVAGVYEGSATVISEDVSRRRFGKTEETFLPLGFEKGSAKARAAAQVERIAFGAAAGATIAGAFGAVIAGQAIPRKNVSRFAEFAGNVVDPGEFPGDVLAGRLRKMYKEPDIPKVRVRGASFSPSGRNPISDVASLFTGQPSQTSSRSKQSTSTKIYSKQFVQSRLPSKIPTQGRTGVPIPVPIPTKEPVRGRSDVPNQTQQEVPSKSTTNVPSMASIPSTSVIYRGGAPLIPPLGAPQEGGADIRGNGRKAYINELRRGARLFNRIL